MIYLVGDTHGTFDLDKVLDFFEIEILLRTVSKEDYLIILGDVGVCWDGGQKDEWVLEKLRSLPVTVLWLDGNHENFDLLKEYPVSDWNGGKVQRIAPDVIHLMRGNIYYIKLEILEDLDYMEWKWNLEAHEYIPETPQKVWAVKTSYGLEYGSLEYVLSELCKCGLYYNYYLSGEKNHAHTFGEVLATLVEHPLEFSINGFEEQYSGQELEFMKRIQQKMESDCGGA